MISIFVNGKFFSPEDAKVFALDIGLTRGLGVYEGITAIGNSVFKLQEHLDRLRKSAGALGILISYSDAKLKEIINTLIQNTQYKRSEIRIYATGGPTIDSINFDPKRSTFIISVDSHQPFPKSLYEVGAKLITHEHLRFMPEYKTTHYVTGVLVQKKRMEAGAIEVLYVFNDKALECSTSNFFAVIDGILVTPKKNVLHGITRNVLIQLAKEKDINMEERDVTSSELLSADEVFIVSSYKDVMPIINIDGKMIADGKVGEITKRMMFDFWKELGYSV